MAAPVPSLLPLLQICNLYTKKQFGTERKIKKTVPSQLFYEMTG